MCATPASFVRALCIFMGLACGMLLAIPLARAGEQDEDCPTVTAQSRDPIPFRPFERTNPSTGARYLPHEIVEVEAGKRVPAKTYFDELDATEARLNAWGYSLRTGGTHTLQRIELCRAHAARQLDAIDKSKSDDDGPIAAIESKLREVERKWNQYKNGFPSFERLAQLADDESVKVYLPAVPPYEAPVPQPKRATMKPVDKEKAWAFETGEKSKLWLRGEAALRVQTGAKEATVSGRGALFASLMGHWEGEALGARVVGRTQLEESSLSVDVRLVGASVYTHTWRSDGVRLERDAKILNVDKSVSFRFGIGPIPCAVTLGFQGTAGLKYGAQLMPIQVLAYAEPYAALKAYAQIGVDIGIAGAGVGGELVLVQQSIPLTASVAMLFEDDQPKVALSIDGMSDLTCLAGRLYAYAYLNLIFDRWEGRWTLFEWEGFRVRMNLFRYEWEWSPGGVRARGDLSAEDVWEVREQEQGLRAVHAENESAARAHEVASAIARDLSGPRAREVHSAHARQMRATAALDASLQAYADTLRSWVEP